LEERASAFQPMAKSDVWEKVFQHLAADADNEYVLRPTVE
jgi:hypothetical protein